eukprot:TRINITY_DN1906_c0_g1_i1.p1 TRINITY_DN1906_c0_g1~~TRINITY_DN1906_c0_g1_i1.p1  ORF type:complete len:359 (-),score=79.46 TRINITY_DN1906_c0_g1_i1:163-1239(-)
MADPGTSPILDAAALVAGTGGNLQRKEVNAAVESYEKYHSSFGGKEDARKLNYADMVNKYYDLGTSFYEYGWGESFHFAHRLKGETLRESIKRHEHFLALKLGLHPDMTVLDVGCGVGGPAREIAAFSGARIIGLNNNAYQISRADQIGRRSAIFHKLCRYVKGDFMNIPAANNTYDAVYAIEATCHAPDSVKCYSEISRVLKKGQLFAGYEWCLTDAYNPSNPKHKQCKEEIELGNGLPEIRTTSQVVKALGDAGFEVLEAVDLAKTSEVPWYQPLDPKHFSVSNFRLTLIGRTITRILVWLLERIYIAPKGSYRVAQFLEKGADGLVDSGRLEVFTPLFYFLARKSSDVSEAALST